MLGGRDRRVTPHQGLELYRALKSRASPVRWQFRKAHPQADWQWAGITQRCGCVHPSRLLWFPEDGHSLSRVDTQADCFLNTALWLQQHLWAHLSKIARKNTLTIIKNAKNCLPTERFSCSSMLRWCRSCSALHCAASELMKPASEQAKCFQWNEKWTLFSPMMQLRSEDVIIWLGFHLLWKEPSFVDRA